LREGEAAERALVQAMLIARDRAEEITEAIARIDDEAMAATSDAPATLRDPVLVAIQQAVLASPQADPVQLAESLGDDATAVLDELFASLDGIVKLDETIDDSLAKLKVRWRRERMAVLERGAAADADARMTERMRLKREMEVLMQRPPRAQH
jgi:hypothetical protein